MLRIRLGVIFATYRSLTLPRYTDSRATANLKTIRRWRRRPFCVVADENRCAPDSAQEVNTGSVSQPRTVEVDASFAPSRSTSHSGKRLRTSSSATLPSRRASAAPRQK